MTKYYEVTFVYYADGKMQGMITTSAESETRPLSSRKASKSKTIYTEWRESREKAEEAIRLAKEAAKK